MTTLEIEPEADELGAVARWCEAQREGPEREFVGAADEAVSRIVAFADASTPAPGVEAPARRVFMKPPPYTVVFAIAHEKRRPGYWLSRVPDPE